MSRPCRCYSKRKTVFLSQKDSAWRRGRASFAAPASDADAVLYYVRRLERSAVAAVQSPRCLTNKKDCRIPLCERLPDFTRKPHYYESRVRIAGLIQASTSPRALTSSIQQHKGTRSKGDQP